LALFQKSVLTTFVQDESKVALRWAAYQKFLAKIDFIKTVKEEKYQDGFLKDIFEACLGYTLDSTNPSNFNLEREKKNETDGKKADGVIYVKGEVVGVVELKDQKTKQLDAIEAQAFNYHNSHSNSKYIIISNFDELRFYIDKKTAYEKFSLFTLSYDEFKKLHLLLSFESIKENIPQKLKEKSANFEQSISKELYKDFSIFRTQLFENIIANNPNIDKSLLLRLTQKLCDRIIFILFAEDRALLRSNTIKEIREEFANQRFTDYKLYDIFKFYFDGINKGNAKLNIPKYNGGLFATDELLDSLKIDDVCLNENAQKLSNYDFVSDISVNILGHIFEQSLSDLEELNASLNDLAFDKKNSKRKKDGVFYTPEYITRYIVENTLGKLCEEQKEALHVKSVEAPKNSKKPTKEEALTKENLERYKEWLLHVKILDPACGSGAFLNQALEYLIKEHKELQEKLAIMGDITAYYEIEASILENNLYGVDINEDAVEIARLSLWLRTAQKGRALANLSEKIKCGNSLIADKTIAENAFVWEEEFPEVFENGGFDVVIGNPPYVFARDNFRKEEKNYFVGSYKLAIYQLNLYILFLEKSTDLLREKGILSFIMPNNWLTINSAKSVREYVLSHSDIGIVNFTAKVFENANVDTAIVMYRKSKDNSIVKLYESNASENIHLIQTTKSSFFLSKTDAIINIEALKNSSLYELLEKIESKAIPLNQIADVKSGLKAYETGKGIPSQTEEMKKNRVYHTKTMIDETHIHYLDGKNVSRYILSWNGEFLKYGQNLAAQRKFEYFSTPRILVRQIPSQPPYSIHSCYTDKTLLNDLNSMNIVNIKENPLFILAILNSRLMSFWFVHKFGKLSRGIFPQFKINELEQFPMVVTDNQTFFIALANEILETKPKINDYKILLDEAITCNNFDREIKLKKEIETLEKRVIECENKIDAMVYELYGLSYDEIKIVEGN